MKRYNLFILFLLLTTSLYCDQGKAIFNNKSKQKVTIKLDQTGPDKEFTVNANSHKVINSNMDIKNIEASFNDNTSKYTKKINVKNNQATVINISGTKKPKISVNPFYTLKLYNDLDYSIKVDLNVAMGKNRSTTIEPKKSKKLFRENINLKEIKVYKKSNNKLIRRFDIDKTDYPVNILDFKQTHIKFDNKGIDFEIKKIDRKKEEVYGQFVKIINTTNYPFSIRLYGNNITEECIKANEYFVKKFEDPMGLRNLTAWYWTGESTNKGCGNLAYSEDIFTKEIDPMLSTSSNTFIEIYLYVNNLRLTVKNAQESARNEKEIVRKIIKNEAYEPKFHRPYPVI
ncbi:MAG: hypothetical protein SZ59_C0003G0041 [candidate division TM6 bacterium GW2011_GWF2_28_16]|nr:MAG: hypothetical protein SZ59_C0003G0041 [candidate division TM6 bacterium GW2011_GWF2_28_16]